MPEHLAQICDKKCDRHNRLTLRFQASLDQSAGAERQSNLRHVRFSTCVQRFVRVSYVKILDAFWASFWVLLLAAPLAWE
jgi:hypothetical protein